MRGPGVGRLTAQRLVAAALVIAVAGCRNPTSDALLAGLTCSIPTGFVADGGPGKDGIPALTNPALVAPGDATLAYLRDTDRVIGLHIGSEFIAVPINILWWHEVLNLDRGEVHLAITHCPLTGSSLVFDRSAVGNVAFGVSGLLYMNNLMMYDRTTPQSLWPQMARGARCGPRDGTALPLFPAVEMRWANWRALHPATTTVSGATGYPRDYTAYPYGSYDIEINAQLLAPIPHLDTRRNPKERVLGIVSGAASAALPFGALRALGEVAAVHLTVGGTPAVVFWNREAESAAAFVPVLDGVPLTFRAAGSRLVDEQEGGTWSADGRALSGPRAGRQLASVPDAFVAYWFAWAAFHPETALWSPA